MGVRQAFLRRRPDPRLLSFFDERVDLKVDGVLQARPVTHWSRPQDRRT